MEVIVEAMVTIGGVQGRWQKKGGRIQLWLGAAESVRLVCEARGLQIAGGRFESDGKKSSPGLWATAG